MASADRGLAALVYGPSRVTAKVADGVEVTIIEDTAYPFEETIRFKMETPRPVKFPLHLRIPGWCNRAEISINGQSESRPQGGQIVVLDRTWKSGDQVELQLPMRVRRSYWHSRSVALERGPLVYALRVEEEWDSVSEPAFDYEPRDTDHRGYRECRPVTPWNYALLRSTLIDLQSKVKVMKTDTVADNPWTLANTPVELHLKGVRLKDWTLYLNSAGPVPRSPVTMPDDAVTESIRLIPYGCTTVRVTGFPWIDDVSGRRR